MILGTAGHIDHGKTALVRALTGVDTDRLPEEKKRGITIDLGFAPLELPDVGTVGVVDVPGHEAFVRTMVAGATGIDVALLVIAADAGIMPQTREHLSILGLLGIERGVVALTKCDLVDDDWLALLEDDVRNLLSSSSMPTAEIVRTSSVSGRGLDALRTALTSVSRHIVARRDDDHFRLPIDRAFSVKGTGTVVTGTVWSGTSAKDESLVLMPVGTPVRVRGLHAHGHAVDQIAAGERAAVAVVGVELDEVHRGMVLTRGRGWAPSRVVRADVMLLGEVDAVSPRTWFRLHLGTQDVGARLVAISTRVGREPVPMRVVLDAPVVTRAGDRFVLRSASPNETIGGGVITDPHAPVRARPWPRAGMSTGERLEHLLSDAGPRGVHVDELPVRLGEPRAVVVRALKQVKAWTATSTAYSQHQRKRLGLELRREVMEYHRAHPLDAGAPLQWLRSRLGVADEAASAVIEELVVSGRLIRANGVLMESDFNSALSESQVALRARLIALLEAAGHEPPAVDEISVELRTPRASIVELAKWLSREGTLIPVEPDRYYLSSTVAALRGYLVQGMTEDREYPPSEIRDLLGFTRKFMIPFLEYCDREGYTIRGASGRRLTLR